MTEASAEMPGTTLELIVDPLPDAQEEMDILRGQLDRVTGTGGSGAGEVSGNGGSSLPVGQLSAQEADAMAAMMGDEVGGNGRVHQRRIEGEMPPLGSADAREYFRRLGGGEAAEAT